MTLDRSTVIHILICLNYSDIFAKPIEKIILDSIHFHNIHSENNTAYLINYV